MAKYKFIVSYDGYNYQGFQIQKDLPTIELEINKAFKKLLDVDVKIYPSGRTDRFVHAIGQVFHTELEKCIPEKGLVKGLNSYLPKDIHIISCMKVKDSFHSRFSAIQKEYRYFINVKEYNPLTVRYMPFIKGLNVENMRMACEYLVGTHDFKSFASAQMDKRKSTIKTIFKIELIDHTDILEFRFVGNGFLKYQIRRMMGILVEIGKGHYNKEFILHLLEVADPKESKYILDGCGLYLYKVDYEEEK